MMQSGRIVRIALGSSYGFRSSQRGHLLGQRYLSSQQPPPENKSSSSKIMWQVGTAAALVATYVAVNVGMQYYEASTTDDDDDDYLDGPGKFFAPRFALLC